MGELGTKEEETGEVSGRQQANEQVKKRETGWGGGVGRGGGGDEGGRSVMKWQTPCQTPHGSETLTHRLIEGEGRRDGWHRDRTGRMTDLST